MTVGSGSVRENGTDFDTGAIDALGVRIDGLAIDSRRIKPGDLFLAYPGERAVGRAHIPQAIAAGASAVLWDSRVFHWDAAWRVPNLGVPKKRPAISPRCERSSGTPRFGTRHAASQ